MRYTVTKQRVEVVGKLWMPMTTAAQVLDLSDYDVENARDEDGKLTRDSLEDWLSKNAGDFSAIEDFHADLEDGSEHVEIPWADEESELTFTDCMFGDEER